MRKRLAILTTAGLVALGVMSAGASGALWTMKNSPHNAPPSGSCGGADTACTFP